MQRFLRLFLFIGVILATLPMSAQFASQVDQPNHIHWSASTKMTSATKGNLIVSAKVDPGYHFYTPENADSPLQLNVVPQEGVKILGQMNHSVAPVSHYDDILKITEHYWDRSVNFTIPFEITDQKDHTLTINVNWQACDENSCTPPALASLKANAKYATPGLPDESAEAKKADAAEEKTPEVAEPAADAAEETVGDDAIDTIVAVDELAQIQADSIARANAQISKIDNEEWWNPVSATSEESKSPLSILLLGFIGGLAALITPCVWPLIPMTISFFLKKSGTKRDANGKKVLKKFVFNKDAILYGVSIVVIYVIIGLAITMIFGYGTLNELSTSAVFNIVFFLILVIFAISFLGAFDIKLPEKWSNAMDGKAERTTGVISIFFMALTLVIVSFSCTGPIIGTLLVEAASQGNIVGPALGMTGFALGLAIPFTLFAMFPTMLNEMPKSGGWLNSVKVVLGFLELILALKFLSVADMAYGWRILDREVFISLWIVLFVMLGMYLLGKLTFPHDDKVEKIGVFRFFLSIFPFAFAVYLLPGLWGAPLKSTSAFTPPIETQDFNLHSHEIEFQEFSDYDEAMKFAAENNRPLLVDFSGYGCVNCRKMEVTVFEDPEVRKALEKDFVMVKLMVDERKPLPEPFVFESNGNKVVCNTYGEKWTLLQAHKFGENSQPSYFILDNNGKSMTEKPMHFEVESDKFMEFLDEGLENYNKNN